MSSNKLIWIGLSVGSFVGSYLPVLWGDSMFSVSSILLTAVGGLAGIYVGYKVSQQL